MTDYSGIFDSFVGHVGMLEAKFLQPHLPLAVGASPDSYDLDVRAFCVLAHSAFEQYVEDICSGLAKDASEAWINNRCCSNVLLGLMVFHSIRQKTEEDEAKPATRFFDYVRLAAESASSEFLTYLRDRNNGVTHKYLRRMLAPVGLDVPDNPKWLGSLTQLATQRGDNAHRWSARRIPQPQDVQTWVADCIEMWAALRDQAKGALNRPCFIEDPRNFVI